MQYKLSKFISLIICLGIAVLLYTYNDKSHSNKVKWDSLGWKTGEIAPSMVLKGGPRPTFKCDVRFATQDRIFAQVGGYQIQLLDAQSGQSLGSYHGKYRGSGVYIKKSPDGHFALLNHGGFKILVNLKSGQVEKRIESSFGQYGFSPSGKMFFTTRRKLQKRKLQKGKIRKRSLSVWDTKTKALIHESSYDSIDDLKFTHDEKHIIIRERDERLFNRLVTLEAKSGNVVYESNKWRQYKRLPGSSIAYYSQLNSTEDINVVTLMDARSGKILHEINIPFVGKTEYDFYQEVDAIRAPNEDIILLSSKGFKENYLWRPESAQPLIPLESLDHRRPFSYAFSPDSTKIIGDSLGTVKLWDTETGKQIGRVGKKITSISSYQFIDDWLVLAKEKKSPRTLRSDYFYLFDFKKGELLKNFKYRVLYDIKHQVILSPDRNRLLVFDGGKSVHVFESHTLAHIATLKGDTHEICSVGISPDGKRVVTGSRGDEVNRGLIGNIMVWDLDK